MDYNGHDEVLLKNSLARTKKRKLDILMRVVKNIINIKTVRETQKRLYMLENAFGKHIKPYSIPRSHGRYPVRVRSFKRRHGGSDGRMDKPDCVCEVHDCSAESQIEKPLA
jgi:hypothetical protein